MPLGWEIGDDYSIRLGRKSGQERGVFTVEWTSSHIAGCIFLVTHEPTRWVLGPASDWAEWRAWCVRCRVGGGSGGGMIAWRMSGAGLTFALFILQRSTDIAGEDDEEEKILLAVDQRKLRTYRNLGILHQRTHGKIATEGNRRMCLEQPEGVTVELM